jgi:hypothetical protein
MGVENGRNQQTASPERPDQTSLKCWTYEARQLGLPEEASWGEIYRGWDEQIRVDLAKELGVEGQSEVATDCPPDYVPWGVILKKLLGLGWPRELGCA